MSSSGGGRKGDRRKRDRRLPARLSGSVIKHSAAIQISNTVTLLQRRAWNVLLANAYDRLLEQETFEIPVVQLMEAIGYESKNVEYLKSALRELTSTRVEWNLLRKDRGNVWGVTTLLSYAEIEKGVCRYSFSEPLRHQLYNPTMYAKISLAVQKRFRSKYALALYELAVDYLIDSKQRGETPYISAEVLRALLGAEKGYNWADFRRYVLEPAVQQVHKHSGLRVEVEYQRAGRRVRAVKFRIRAPLTSGSGEDSQAQEEMEGALHELTEHMVELGIPRGEAEAICALGFEWVEEDRRPESGTFVDYLREKLDLLSRWMKRNQVRNPAGFLLHAIRENYPNPEALAELRRGRFHELSLKRQKLAAEVRSLEEKCRQVTQEVVESLMEKAPIRELYEEAAQKGAIPKLARLSGNVERDLQKATVRAAIRSLLSQKHAAEIARQTRPYEEQLRRKRAELARLEKELSSLGTAFDAVRGAAKSAKTRQNRQRASEESGPVV